MRVLLVVHQYPPYRLGGTEVYTRNLATELARRGHEPLVYFRADLDDRPFAAQEETLEGIRAHRVSAPLTGWRAHPLIEFYRTFCNPALERDFVDFLRREQPDLVHFQHVMALSARLLLLARGLGFPTFLTLHDYWFICANAQLIWPNTQVCQGKAGGLNCARCALARFGGGPQTVLLRPVLAPLFLWRDRMVRRAAWAAARWISPSHFLIGCYQQAGFPADRLTFLENGLDLERLGSYSWCPTVDGRVRFTFIGSLAWQKGVHVAVEAFREVPADRARLRIYGSLHTFPDYAARLIERHNPETTEFMGFIPNSEVGSVLAETDYLLVPSLWYENSPVVIQEAFAMGVPVIASRIGAMVEKVHEGQTGWLFTPGDSIALRQLLLQLIHKDLDLLRPLVLPFPVLSVAEHTERLLNIYESG